jgi:hypothetical protein
MEVHQACIGVIARELNKYSNAWGEVDVLCPDGKVYGMNTLLWYTHLQLGQARVSHAHFKHVFLTGKGTFTAGRMLLLMMALPFALRNLLHQQLAIIRKDLFRREACVSITSATQISDLRVIPAGNINARACLAQYCFDGRSRYHTIPRQFSHHEARHFAGGKADKAVPCSNASKFYELNVWAMT